ncbi:hypothetical protein NDR87_04405 [Nocardia sp. CDC159]|uniref:Secreted protein n=1 Tax=Nocardia pulmonis TaxID=2951408 RepID=A0A9X2IXQ7_9NOCA|nr:MULTISPECIES: hypothetical protein [Nocardia]MCM6773096.1 hypothetical protein [Nocardia pulmonis]MCM6785601.1 hypothetical protein [Nocardia sp. CDC159]
MEARVSGAVRGRIAWLRRFAATTPGTIIGIAAAAVVLCLISGLVCAEEFSARTAHRDDALMRSEPLADAAQRLYVALSSADAAAATAFLSGGIESREVRGRYEQALADAAQALAVATAGASDARTREIVARVAADLPVYTGLVETARANHRQGFPVGAAYLREASGVMQNSLLPNASELTAQRLAAVRADQRAVTGPPWVALALSAIVLGGAMAASRVLSRRTNRRFNLGLVVAGGAAALAVLWIVVAAVIARGAIDTGTRGPTARGENLAQARILAQQARTDETLQLITNGDITDIENDFAAKTSLLGAALEQAGSPESPVHQQFSQWMSGHRNQLDNYRAADYQAAVRQAIGPGPESSAGRFADLDAALRNDLTATRAELRQQIGSAGAAWFGAAAGTLVLMVIAAAGVVAGLWPRLKEFL